MSAGYSNRPIATYFWLRIQGGDVLPCKGGYEGSEKAACRQRKHPPYTAGRFERLAERLSGRRLIYDASAPFMRINQQRFEIALDETRGLIGKIEEIKGNSSLGSAVTLVSRRTNAHRFVISFYHSFRF